MGAVCCRPGGREGSRGGNGDDGANKFRFASVPLPKPLEEPVRFMAAAPTVQVRDSPSLHPRLAVAGESKVMVFRRFGGENSTDDPEKQVLTLSVEHERTFSPDEVITAVLFADDNASRLLAIALAPRPTSAGADDSPTTPALSRVEVWDCDAESWTETKARETPVESPPEPCAAHGEKVEEDCADCGRWVDATANRPLAPAEASSPGAAPTPGALVCELECGASPVQRLAAGGGLLLAADGAGRGRVWCRRSSFDMQGEVQMHEGELSGLAVDRGAAFSTGILDMTIGVWSAVDLVLLARIDVCAGLQKGPTALYPDARPPQLTRLTACFRPSARWVRQQTRGLQKTPPGLLFVAGVREAEDGKAQKGVLMKWNLGETPECLGVQAVHDESVTSLVYGPYDNGPLVTADALGIYRVWEWGSRLRRMQERAQPAQPLPSHAAGTVQGASPIAVEPRKGLLTISGDGNVCSWRLRDSSKPQAPQPA